MFKKLSPLILCMATLAPFNASALSEGDGDGKISFGVQSGLIKNSLGLSAKYDYSESMKLQGVVGVFGTTSFEARALYNFVDSPEYDVYGFGVIGGFNSDDGLTFGLGGGVGLEYDLSNIAELPILVSGEFGLATVDKDSGTESAFELGFGVHYKF